MKKFLSIIISFFTIPIIVLFVIFYWTDPFRILNQFDINDVDITNREYMSTELFIKNKDTIKYDSFIFGSSRANGINTYSWKMYLSSISQPYLFQAWSETITGIYQKIKFLDDNKINIKNSLVLIDIPNTFKKEQLPRNSLSIKHYRLTNTSRIQYILTQFYNFCQKPTLWLSSIRNKINKVKTPYSADIITNDWVSTNKYNYHLLPQDSLRGCSSKTKETFLHNYNKIKNNDQNTSEILINEEFYNILKEIKLIFDDNQTDYYIIITPAICKLNPRINDVDLQILSDIFGNNKIYDYSTCNEFTTDYNDYFDPNHFGLSVGFRILKDIYSN